MLRGILLTEKKKHKAVHITILEPLVVMISTADVYHVVEATVPLYFAMILAYFSVKWWKLFTPDQCAGINKFVAKFSIPLLSFQVISSINPYKMNLKLIFADFLQKLLALLALTALAKISSRGRLNWVITGLSLSTLPNTLILGIPLLRAMYGAEAEPLISQIVGLQSLIWYNLLLFLFELNATKEATMAPSSETAGICVSFINHNKIITNPKHKQHQMHTSLLDSYSNAKTIPILFCQL